MSRIKSIEEMCYDSLLEYALVLIDIINKLPNVKEIKQRPEYIKSYNKFNKNYGKYFNQKRGIK